MLVFTQQNDIKFLLPIRHQFDYSIAYLCMHRKFTTSSQEKNIVEQQNS